MKLLLREHLSLTIIYVIQLALTILIFWLSGFRQVEPTLYAIFLSTCLFLFYLGYRYVSHRSLYQRLSKPLQEFEDVVMEQSNRPFSNAVAKLLGDQHRLYRNQIYTYEKKLKNRITFINQWVHQMKTPLSVIHLTIQDEDEPIFDSIREELDRLSHGLETVLYSSRLDLFEQDFRVEQIKLEELVNHYVSANRRLFIRNRVYPDVTIDPKWVVASDEKWLAFIFGQIITNAVRYSASSGEKIEINAYIRGKGLVLEVTDYGVGIPVEDQKRVFDAYFTGRNGRDYHESTGMGLYLVREACQKLGHKVELESQEGVGTKVRLIFNDPQGLSELQ